MNKENLIIEDGVLKGFATHIVVPKDVKEIGVLQIKVKHPNEKSPAKFARPKKGATNQTGEKVPHRPR